MQTVTISGEQYPVLYNANSLFEFIELSGYSLDKLVTIQKEAGGLTFSQARLLIWCGLKEGFLEQGRMFDLTPRDVGKLFDPISENMKYFTEFMKIFRDSIPVPEVGEKEQTKKK